LQAQTLKGGKGNTPLSCSGRTALWREQCGVPPKSRIIWVKVDVHCYVTSTIRTNTSAVTELKLVRFLQKQICYPPLHRKPWNWRIRRGVFLTVRLTVMTNRYREKQTRARRRAMQIRASRARRVKVETVDTQLRQIQTRVTQKTA
jgi:hypothetical protein